MIRLGIVRTWLQCAIITAAQGEDDTPYYTNSSHLPVGYTEDIFSALDIQDELQTLYTSGTVFHAFLGEKLPDWKAAATLVRKIAENYKLPYYTISPTYSVCKNHGYLAGETYTCPICHEKTEVYSRITGYYRPVQNWNDGKRQEFIDRVEYVVGEKPQEESEEEVSVDAEARDGNVTGVLLIGTKTCPNCKLAIKKLEEANIPFEKLYAEDNIDKAVEYGVKTVPALIVHTGNSYYSVVGVSNVIKWISNRQK